MGRLTEMKRSEYDLVPIEDDPDQWAVALLDGPYDGVVYKYGTVSFDENTEEGPTLSFVYDIMDNPDEVDTESEHFKNYIGDVLTDIVERKMEEDARDGDGPGNTVEPSD